MQPAKLLIDPERLPFVAADPSQPLGLIDLDACGATTRIAALPPFPLIGIGNPQHALAASLDAVIEAPIGLESLVATVSGNPQAAAVAVQLLRNSADLAPARALQLESVSYGLLQGGAEFTAWLAARKLPVGTAPPGRVLVERQGEQLRLTLDRPDAHNAIDVAMRDALFEALTVAVLDPDLRLVSLAARGRSFCTGGDLAEFGTVRDPVTAHLIRSRTLPALRLAECAGKLSVQVQGACVGAGLEMAAFAARVTATADAWFQLPELSMGLIPGAGGCVSVPRRIGRQRAGLLMLSGRRISATTALRWGLIDEILPMARRETAG